MVSRTLEDSLSVSSLESDMDGDGDVPSDGSASSVGASDWEDVGQEDDHLEKSKTEKGGSSWRLELDSSLSMQAKKLRQKEQTKASFLLTSLTQTKAAESKKAEKVKVQKRLSDDLLAFRIRLNEALRQTNRLPVIDAFKLLECDTSTTGLQENTFLLSSAEKHKKHLSQDGTSGDPKRDSSSGCSSSLPALLARVRQEAAQLFVDMHALQGSIFSQGSLAEEEEDEEEEEEEEDEEREDWEAVRSCDAAERREDSWEARRRRWRRMQMELARGQEEAETKAAETADAQDLGEHDKGRSCTRRKRQAKTEMAVWGGLVDALWSRKAKRRCLEKIDAWHATVEPRSQSFKALSQPPSLQLQHAMTTQYSRLLSRSLRSAHLPRPSSSPASAPKGSLSRSIAAQEKQDKANTGKLSPAQAACHIVGCDPLQRLWRRRREEKLDGEEEGWKEEDRREEQQQHYYYDDGDFYLELLKQVVKQGGTLDSGDALEKEKSLLKIRNKLNRTRTDVDRRASKGRKIRYQPIEKLQNLVAAIPWHPNLEALPGAGDPTIVDRLMSQLFANE